MKVNFLEGGAERKKHDGPMGGLHVEALGNFKAVLPGTAGTVTAFLILSQFCSWKLFSGLFNVHILWRTRLPLISHTYIWSCCLKMRWLEEGIIPQWGPTQKAHLRQLTGRCLLPCIHQLGLVRTCVRGWLPRSEITSGSESKELSQTGNTLMLTLRTCTQYGQNDTFHK